MYSCLMEMGKNEEKNMKENVGDCIMMLKKLWLFFLDINFIELQIGLEKVLRCGGGIVNFVFFNLHVVKCSWTTKNIFPSFMLIWERK